MKKSIVGIVAVAVIGLLGAPYVTGFLAESETRRIIVGFNKNSAEYGTTDIMSYERGVRSSHIVYEYELPIGLSSMLGIGDKVSYECDYEHGITGIDYSCDFLSDSGYKKFIGQYFGDENPLLIKGDISAFGGFTQEISTQSINKTLEDGTVIKFDESEVLLESDSGFSSLSVDAGFGAANFQGEGGVLSIDKSSLAMNVKLTDLGLLVGDYSMMAGALKVVSEQEKFSIDGLKFSGTSTERGKVMDSIVQVSVERFSSDAVDGMSIENMDVDVEFLGINSQVLVDYQNFSRTLQTDLIANVEQGGQAEVDPNQMMALLPIIERMLEKGLNFKLDMSGDVNGKPNSAELDLKLLKKTSFAQWSTFMFDPESVLKSLDFRVSGSLNKESVGSNSAVGPLIDRSPLFVSKGDVYALNIKLAEESEVNGKKVSFQELRSMVMSSMM